eukprot:3193997-Prymnesium_polylepis.1
MKAAKRRMKFTSLRFGTMSSARRCGQSATEEDSIFMREPRCASATSFVHSTGHSMLKKKCLWPEVCVREACPKKAVCASRVTRRATPTQPVPPCPTCDRITPSP